jgi:surface polysaccharide O-acyltransferase-like enzyme
MNALSPFVLQWLFGLPAALIGLGAGYWITCSDQKLKTIALAGTVAAVIAACILLASRGFSDLSISYSIGVSLTCIAFLLPLPLFKGFPILSSLMLGVYLLHPAVAMCIRALVPRIAGTFTLAVVTFTASLVIAWLLSLMPTLRRFVS